MGAVFGGMSAVSRSEGSAGTLLRRLRAEAGGCFGGDGEIQKWTS